MTDIGHAILLLVLVFSGYTAVVACLAGRWRQLDLLASARRGARVTLGLVTLAVSALAVLLLRRDYQVRYVYQHVNSSLRPLCALAALWTGQEGMFLLWLWFLAILGATLTRQRTVGGRELEPYALATVSATEGFFAFLLCFVSQPFALLPARALEGMGLNPFLGNPAMIYHPLALLLGYAAYTIPFAWAVAALATGHLGEEWIRGIRRWNLLAWGSLGLGLLLGARWAYVELGRGSYWAWEPIENASLIPWLAGTALLHSTIMQERRGLFKVWNLLLVIGIFLLCLLATFIRSGLTELGQADSRPAVGYGFLAFVGLTLVVSLGLVLGRRAQLRSQAALEKVVSREGTFLLNNLLFSGLAAAILLGTGFLLLAKASGSASGALDRAVFDRVSRPLALVILLLLGVCPLLGWRQAGNLHRTLVLPVSAGLTMVGVLALALHVREHLALAAFGLIALVAVATVEEILRGILARRRVTGEPLGLAVFNLFHRNRRRYGGYVVHLAVVLVALGITGEGLYKVERQATVQRGEGIAVGRYTVRWEGLSSEMAPDQERHVATVGVYLGDQRIGTLRPEYNLSYNVRQYRSEAAILGTLREDLYVAVAAIASDGRTVTFRVFLNPLMSWLWIGGAVMLVGTVIAFWPEGLHAIPVTAPSARRAAS